MNREFARELNLGSRQQEERERDREREREKIGETVKWRAHEARMVVAEVLIILTDKRERQRENEREREKEKRPDPQWARVKCEIRKAKQLCIVTVRGDPQWAPA